MKIALDGGALCAPPHAQYGTYRFSTELIRALNTYSRFSYTAYTFCTIPPTTDLKQPVEYKNLTPSTAWMDIRIPIEEKLHPSDIFLGLNQTSPRFSKAKKIIFSHGLSFLKYPKLYPTDFPRLKKQLDRYIHEADVIVVSSRAVKKELLEYAPDLKPAIVILPFGLPADYADTSVLKVRKEPYFLYVGSGQPIKNLPHLIETFNEFRKDSQFADFQLKLVGTHFEELPSGVIQQRHASLEQLQQLYSSASAYLAVSSYESFNYPVIEALSLGCPVLGYKSAIIPEQRKFTHCAGDQAELIDLMKLAASGALPHIDRKELLKRFSWETYLKSLEKLFTI